MCVKVRDFSMAYSEAGKGTPLLCIHGFPLNRHLWQPQIESLSDIVRVVAPDLRGHGESQAIPGPYSMELFADDLNAFLDILGITQRVVLCGLSMGGYVAFAFYRKYSFRMAGLILTATRAAADSPEARRNRDAALQTAKEQGISAIVETMLPRLLSPRNYSNRADLVARVREIMEHVSIEGIVGDLIGLKERPDSTTTLSQISVPTLIVVGADDQVVPLAEAKAMQAGIRGARLEVIPDAGHLPNLEQPTVFNAIVRDFLISEDLIVPRS